MAYGFSDPRIGAQPIANTSTVQQHPLGTVLKAYDPSIGEGEFIYLLGVVGTAIGLLAKYNATTWQTAIVTATAVQNVPIGVAMSANVASQYGWYQISGNAVVKKTAVAVSPQVPVFISATAGRVKVIASAGLQVIGARSANLATVTSTTSTVTVTMERVALQSQIT
jgi:hypothetical protein